MADVQEQMATLESALAVHFIQNWQQFAPGEQLSPAEIQVKSAQFAKWFAQKAVSGDKSVYGGTKPFADYAVKADGTLNNQLAGTLNKKGAAHYANFKAETPAAAPLVVTSDEIGDLGNDALNNAKEPIEASGETALPREDAAPQEKIDEPFVDQEPKTPEQLAADDTATHSENAGGEQAAASASETPAAGEADAGTAPDAPQPDASNVRTPQNREADFVLEAMDWSQVKSVYKPFSDEIESEVGNGNAGLADVRYITNSKFYDLDYGMMRTLAVHYGGYERDLNFRDGIEKFADQYGVQVKDLLDPNNTAQYLVNGRAIDAQSVLHGIYKDKSLLMGNPLENDGADNKFGLDLVQAGYVKKKKFGALSVNEEKSFAQTGNYQMSYGSTVVFKDTRGSMYADDGQKVFMRMSHGEQFGAEHAINLSRIYLSARQNPEKAEPGDLQHVKFAISSGLGMVSGNLSRLRGANGKHAERRDLMLLGALHQGMRADMVPDLHEKSAFGVDKKIGPLSMNDLNPNAVAQFKQLGIDVGQLLAFHNYHLGADGMANNNGLGIDGEEAAMRTDTPAPIVPQQPEAAASEPQPQQDRLSMRDLAATPIPELATKLLGGELPDPATRSEEGQQKLQSFMDATKQAQLGARLSELAREPQTPTPHDFMESADTDSDNVKEGIDILNHFKLAQERGETLKGDAMFQVEALGKSMLDQSEDSFNEMGLGEIADKIRGASIDFEAARPDVSIPGEMPLPESVLETPAGAPIVRRSPTAAPDMRATQADRLVPPRAQNI